MSTGFTTYSNFLGKSPVIEYLNIPAIPKDIEIALIDRALSLIDSEGYATGPSIIDEVIGHYDNMAARKTLRHFKLQDNSLELRFREFILTHFGKEKDPLFIIINNTRDYPAIFPPHNDYGRIVALNYVLVPGGDNVTTSFYAGPQVDRLNNKFYTLDMLQLINRTRIDTGRWHTFDAQCIHSVENLISTRILLAILKS